MLRSPAFMGTILALIVMTGGYVFIPPGVMTAEIQEAETQYFALVQVERFGIAGVMSAEEVLQAPVFAQQQCGSKTRVASVAIDEARILVILEKLD